MTPAARIQAAIEILDIVIAAARDGGAAADTVVTRYFAQRRYAGSKDRRAVRDYVYAAIRALGEMPVSGRAAMLAMLAEEDRTAAFTGEGHAPAPFQVGEPVADKGLAPAWLAERLSQSGVDDAELAALVDDRAPLDIRVNRRVTTAADIIREIEGATPIDGLADGLRVPSGFDMTSFAGRVEVQDAGSQFVSLAAGAQPGMVAVDLCAGGGGKALALATAMDDNGEILAADVNRDRLSRLTPRAARAGVGIITTLLMDPGREAEALIDWNSRADLVLIDAPCSGTGTWRRNPEARWRLNPAMLGRLAVTQRHLLDIAVPLVKPGGTITYIVCSLIDDEGRGQIATFLDRYPGWRAEPVNLPVGRSHGDGLRLTPRHDWTDGFFVATLRAPC